MCVNSCVAFTGPHESLNTCPRCKEPRYCPGTTKPQKRFTMIPMGPVIQAMYSSRTVAESMHYLERKLVENVDLHARLGGGMLDFYDDTASGQALLDAWTVGHIKRGDVALQFSIDGAQLRADRPSEAWFFIWVIHNLPPNMRYKKVFVIPGAIVPGPGKPWDIDSFMFPSLYHIAALQREGLSIYDASLSSMVQSRPLVILGTADSPGSAFMSGMVGHSGRVGCRLYCDMPSRRRMGDGHYYPAMNRPHDYDVDGCCHPDVLDEALDDFQKGLPVKYKQNLDCLLAGSTTLTDYRLLRLALGLCKQTLFSGLPCQPIPVPSLFTMDIMHLSVLNDPDLFLKLFTGKLESTNLMIELTGTGLSSIAGPSFGVLTVKQSLDLCHSFHHLSGVRLETPQRRSTLATKHGSFKSMSMVCVRLCLGICSLESTGLTFANSSLVSDSAAPSDL